MAPAVLIQNLQKRYGTVVAVQDVSFQVESGEIFGLLGPNGAGNQEKSLVYWAPTVLVKLLPCVPCVHSPHRMLAKSKYLASLY